MEFRLHHIIDHLYNIFLENDGLENCAQLLEEEVNKMLCTKYLNDEQGCNVVSTNSLNSEKLMMIAQVMTKMFLINMSLFAEWIGSAFAHQKGKINFVRSINI